MTTSGLEDTWIAGDATDATGYYLGNIYHRRAGGGYLFVGTFVAILMAGNVVCLFLFLFHAFLFRYFCWKDGWWARRFVVQCYRECFWGWCSGGTFSSHHALFVVLLLCPLLIAIDNTHLILHLQIFVNYYTDIFIA